MTMAMTTAARPVAQQPMVVVTSTVGAPAAGAAIVDSGPLAAGLYEAVWAIDHNGSGDTAITVGVKNAANSAYVASEFANYRLSNLLNQRPTPMVVRLATSERLRAEPAATLTGVLTIATLQYRRIGD